MTLLIRRLLVVQVALCCAAIPTNARNLPCASLLSEYLLHPFDAARTRRFDSDSFARQVEGLLDYFDNGGSFERNKISNSPEDILAVVHVALRRTGQDFTKLDKILGRNPSALDFQERFLRNRLISLADGLLVRSEIGLRFDWFPLRIRIGTGLKARKIQTLVESLVSVLQLHGAILGDKGVNLDLESILKDYQAPQRRRLLDLARSRLLTEVTADSLEQVATRLDLLSSTWVDRLVGFKRKHRALFTAGFDLAVSAIGFPLAGIMGTNLSRYHLAESAKMPEVVKNTYIERGFRAAMIEHQNLLQATYGKRITAERYLTWAHYIHRTVLMVGLGMFLRENFGTVQLLIQYLDFDEEEVQRIFEGFTDEEKHDIVTEAWFESWVLFHNAPSAKAKEFAISLEARLNETEPANLLKEPSTSSLLSQFSEDDALFVSSYLEDQYYQRLMNAKR